MGQTITDLERQREHAAALAELRRQRAEVAGKLARLDEKLAQCEDGNFRSRVGTLKVSEMTTREKVETVNRLGFAGFADLVLGRR
jgi:hypothetical protein